MEDIAPYQLRTAWSEARDETETTNAMALAF